MSCLNGCFEALISSCEDIIIKAGFTTGTELFWIINKIGSNNIYQKQVVTDVDDELVISKADLPPGFLTPGNFYRIQVRKGNDYLKEVTLVQGTANYTCIRIQIAAFIKEVADTSGTNTITFTSKVIPV
jgi:hypothetical protein